MVIELFFLQDMITKYHNIHIIQALITEASSHTNKQKTTKNEIIAIVLNTIGINLIKNHRKIINIVILNQLTAIRWVVHESLKLSFRLLCIFSLAQIRIQAKNIASSLG